MLSGWLGLFEDPDGSSDLHWIQNENQRRENCAQGEQHAVIAAWHAENKDRPYDEPRRQSLIRAVLLGPGNRTQKLSAKSSKKLHLALSPPHTHPHPHPKHQPKTHHRAHDGAMRLADFDEPPSVGKSLLAKLTWTHRGSANAPAGEGAPGQEAEQEAEAQGMSMMAGKVAHSTARVEGMLYVNGVAVGEAPTPAKVGCEMRRAAAPMICTPVNFQFSRGPPVFYTLDEAHNVQI